MAINKEGRHVEVYDTIEASAIEDNDLILYEGDQIEVTSHFDEGDSIFVRGISFVTGDSVRYIIPADTIIELWSE